MAAAGAQVRELSSAAEVEPGPVAADVLVFHWMVEGEPDDAHGELELAILAELADRLPAGAQVIVLAPRDDLATFVAALSAHPRVATVLFADRLRASHLTTITTRLLFGDIFGLNKVLPWGARVHTLLVGDPATKTDALQQISAFATTVGLRRTHRDRIERCCDEMIMSALHDAASAPDGNPAKIGRAGLAADFSLPPNDRALVEFGCDGQRFAVSVRDRFGRFDRVTLLRYLERCLYADQQLDERTGGAGLGLYHLTRLASTVMFNLLPGAATECICLFDGATASAHLEQIGVFYERPDLERAPPPPLLVARAIQLAPAGGPADSHLRTELVPPLRRPKRPWRRRRTAHRDQNEGGRTAVRESGRLRELARVVGLAPDRTYWLVAAGLIFLLGIAGLAIGLPRLSCSSGSGPDPSGRLARAARLEPIDLGDDSAGGALSVTASVPGRVTVEGAPSCSDRPLPLERCPLRDGQYTVVITSDDIHLRHSFVVEIRGRLVERTVRVGYVEARPGFRLRTARGEPPVARVALPEGWQVVTLTSQAPGSSLDLNVPVKVDQTVLVP